MYHVKTVLPTGEFSYPKSTSQLTTRRSSNTRNVNNFQPHQQTDDLFYPKRKRTFLSSDNEHFLTTSFSCVTLLHYDGKPDLIE